MEMTSSEYSDLEAAATVHREQYASASPYPHIVFRNFFNESVLDSVVDEFPDLSKSTRSDNFDRIHEALKFASKDVQSFGQITNQFIGFLNSMPFLTFLQELTGIQERLIPDPYLVGGGLHEIKQGGRLDVHADFNKHSLTGLDRRINVLVYLNKDWEDSFGGHFQLWNRDMTECQNRILPLFNTLAIFSTTSYSYHGHPEPLTCPEDRSRRSIALYYYTNGRPEDEIDPEIGDHSTIFKLQPGENRVGRQARHVAGMLKDRKRLISALKHQAHQWTPPAIANSLVKLRSN